MGRKRGTKTLLISSSSPDMLEKTDSCINQDNALLSYGVSDQCPELFLLTAICSVPRLFCPPADSELWMKAGLPASVLATLISSLSKVPPTCTFRSVAQIPDE